MEDSSKICKPGSKLQDSGPSQLSIHVARLIILKGIFEHERIKPTVTRTSHGNVQNLAELRQVMNTELKLD